MKIDAVTKRWMRNVTDEHAVANGCRFDEARGQFVVDWIQDNCVLYEGEWAGQPMQVVDWQYEFFMRSFGWVKWSDRWNRMVRRFRELSVWIPKKNKKSPTLAALGLYLTCGDGEQGGKTFFGAKDGSQARAIAGKHAIEMVLASPTLSAICDVNKSEMQIMDVLSRSILRPMSSGDSKSQKSKEGLNGNALVDEVHVVDEAFMGRISRMGISRSEPIQAEVSTAGDDPESYGYKRYEYGKSVERGDVVDEALLFLCYEAPQDLSDAALAKNPVKYGKLANPAWGHTIGEEEFLADFQKSKDRPTELARFKMYRLNIWQRVAAAWLRQDDWKRCRRTFGQRDLLDCNCYGGLDLSMTSDMTAFVLMFPRDDGEFLVRPYFWLPEEIVNDSPKEYLRNWAATKDADGQPVLRTTPGNVCDYPRIAAEIVEIIQDFRFQGLAFDPWHAEQLTQQLEAEHGIDRFVFRQNIGTFARPTGEFERLVRSGKLHHNGHPILTWQAGHVKVVTDNNANMRPVKPAHGSPLKIDGIVASIMALSLATAGADGGPSVYDSDDRPDGLLIL